MPINVASTRERLQNFEFAPLFIEELGWEPPARRKVESGQTRETRYSATPVARLAGVGVFEIAAQDGRIPEAKARAIVQKQVSEYCYENLLIFVDGPRTQSLWYWVKRDAGKTYPRDHLYVKGQPGDLFLSKLAALVVDISELDAQGNISVTEVANRLRAALDVERVTKKFYGEFDTQRLAFVEHIQGIADDRQRRWYASVLMNRLMFIWFLQCKGFLDGADRDYLTRKLAESRKRGTNQFYAVFLNALFFEGFAQPEPARSEATRVLLGRIRYLNGGLFRPHRVELDHGFPGAPRIAIPDGAFDNVFALFGRYSWNLNDTPGGNDEEINPDVLGYIFEKYINQKQFGAYYTRPEITGYLCERTIHQLVLDRANKALDRRYTTLADLLLNLDANLCRALLFDILPSLRLLDPACGSAAFLVAAMKVLIALYSAAIGRIQFLNDAELLQWYRQTKANHRSILYFVKKQIITNNLFGVDIMEEATEIARLRLFLALVASAQTEDQLEPLPNIDFNILAGNSLVGLLHVDAGKFDAEQQATAGVQERLVLQHSADLGFSVESKTAPTKREKAAAFVAERNAARFAAVLTDKNTAIDLYRKHAFLPGEKDGLDQEERILRLREHIEKVRQQSYTRLNQMLLDEFKALGIQFEQATWDEKKSDTGKSKKRALSIADMDALQPFHWGYEFDKVLESGGFDGIVTNPPWEIFKPNAKEFFEEHSDLVSKKSMTIKEFEKEQAKLLRDTDVRAAWLEYQSRYRHLSAFFRSAAQYKNQISVVDGKKAGTDINLYKLFLEQCQNLLRPGGRCGIVIPSSIYADLGAKQLREMLFGQCRTDAIRSFSNEGAIFDKDAVHHAFKFCLLTYEKAGRTTTFAASFRINPREAIAPDRLDEFLHSPTECLELSVDLVRRLAPDSLSVMEFQTLRDVRIAEKVLKQPLLGEDMPDRWSVSFAAEFHMTNDSDLFKAASGKGRLPLYEGKTIWQFDSKFSATKWWVEEKQGRAALKPRKDGSYHYEVYRLGFRDVAASTNERTLIAALIPPRVFCGNTLPVLTSPTDGPTALALCSLLDSFIVDWIIRQRVTNHCSFFYMYQLPVPRLTEEDATFWPIVKRAARLVCTTPEFDGLAQEVRLKSHKDGATDPADRARLRAELDGLIAHLYGLTEEEFAHILTTFPLVSEDVKLAARNAYRDVQNGLIK